LAASLVTERLGIGIIHEEVDLFRNLSADENMCIGTFVQGDFAAGAMGAIEGARAPFSDGSRIGAIARACRFSRQP